MTGEKMVKCKVCGKEFVETATYCPHCGTKSHNDQKPWYKVWWKCVIVGFCALCIFGQFVGEDVEDSTGDSVDSVETDSVDSIETDTTENKLSPDNNSNNSSADNSADNNNTNSTNNDTNNSINNSTNNSVNNTQNLRPVYTPIDIETLAEELYNNPAKAKKDYTKAKLEITGELVYIHPDGEYMELAPNGSPWYRVECNLNKEHLESLYAKNKGDRITVCGKVTKVNSTYYVLAVHEIK